MGMRFTSVLTEDPIITSICTVTIYTEADRTAHSLRRFRCYVAEPWARCNRLRERRLSLYVRLSIETTEKAGCFCARRTRPEHEALDQREQEHHGFRHLSGRQARRFFRARRRVYGPGEGG